MKSINEIELEKVISDRKFTPSPAKWEDQVLYFLVVDRFSNGEESDLYSSEDYENALKNDSIKNEWDNAGSRWNGGTLKGVKSKLQYLKKLGITTIWVSPVFQQVYFEESYHGYGIQNFLEIDKHFGSKNDLKELVDEAHKLGMFIVLDIIINHTGNVFQYENGEKFYNGNEYEIAGFNDETGKASIPLNSEADKLDIKSGIWPKELLTKDSFTRKGQIVNWDNSPEFIEGDFFSLKNVNTGFGDVDNFTPSNALKTITECFKYWIAFADIDGFRLDTVKHVFPGAIKYFVREIHEFANTIGKDNFYIIGEITGGLNFSIDIQQKTGIDAALGINKIPEKLENVAKGYTEPKEFFDLFKNSDLEGEDKYKWYNNKVISMFDDHDMVTQQGNKSRFCADKGTSPLLLNAIALNVMSPGIPCLYYGTEQGFDGSGNSDKYIREAMFGGKFGAFRTTGKHFFNDSNLLYKDISKLLAVRKENLCLRQGRTYLREISYDGNNFEFPHKLGSERFTGLIAWSRILSNTEIIIIINCDIVNDKSAFVSVDSSIHKQGANLNCIYSSTNNKNDKSISIIQENGRNYIKVEVPKHSCMIYRNS